MKCKHKGCGKLLRRDNACGHCRKHRWKVRKVKSYKRRTSRVEYRRNYYEAHKEAEMKRAADWAKANPEARKAINRRSMKKWRDNAVLAELAQIRATAQPSKPSPAVSRLLELAEAKATQAQYGITRIGYQEAR